MTSGCYFEPHGNYGYLRGMNHRNHWRTHMHGKRWSLALASYSPCGRRSRFACFRSYSKSPTGPCRNERHMSRNTLSTLNGTRRRRAGRRRRKCRNPGNYRYSKVSCACSGNKCISLS